MSHFTVNLFRTFSSRFANREQNQYSSTEMQSRVGRLRTSATRFHILGPGGIGSLFAYYFYQHKIPFTFFQRKAPTAEESALRKSASHSPTTLKYMNLTALDKVSVEPQPVHGIQWEPLYPIIDKELFRSDPVYNQLSRSPIHHLVIATKTFQTVGAISKIRHRLRPWTTIVLLQNGMGVREEICEAMGWTSDLERPNFVQGIISHGAQKSGNTVIHTGRGNVYIAPVYDPSTETSTSPQGSSSLRSLLQRPEDGSLYPELVTPSKKIMSTPYPLGMHSRFSAPFSKDPFSSFYQPLSSTEELVALKTRSLYETLASFQLLSEDMDLKVLSPEHLLALQLSKLVVNSCVNPVATLLGYTNGELLDSKQAYQAMINLVEESHEILIHTKEYQTLGPQLQNEFLSLEAMTENTRRILGATRQNRCSMLQDYTNGSAECEIDYMNGVLVQMALRSGVEPRLHRMVSTNIKEKFVTPRNVSSPKL